jgi:DNA-directed RNA polymerase specialized sigma24 family protein
MSLVTSIGEVEDRTAAIAGREPTPSAVAIARERWDSLMQEQPPQVRTILNKRLAGAKYSDIADELGLHERTVRKAVKKVFSRCRS